MASVDEPAVLVARRTPRCERTRARAGVPCLPWYGAHTQWWLVHAQYSHQWCPLLWAVVELRDARVACNGCACALRQLDGCCCAMHCVTRRDRVAAAPAAVLRPHPASAPPPQQLTSASAPQRWWSSSAAATTMTTVVMMTKTATLRWATSSMQAAVRSVRPSQPGQQGGRPFRRRQGSPGVRAEGCGCGRKG
jgi:hypothetical protein